MSDKTELTFEEALAKLETASNALNNEQTTLEEAMKCYEDGIKYYKICSEILKNAKQKIQVFQNDLEKEE